MRALQMLERTVAVGPSRVRLLCWSCCRQSIHGTPNPYGRSGTAANPVLRECVIFQPNPVGGAGARAVTARITWYDFCMAGVDTVAKRRRGRRSLSGAGDSPQLRVRLSDELRDSLSRRAAHQGVTVSELARRVLSAAAEDRPETRVQLELHRTVLGKLLADPEPVRQIAQRNLERMRGSVRGPQAQGWLDEWAELLKHPGSRLVEALLGEDEHSIDLRQVSPFAGALTQRERMAAIERARANAPT